MFVEFNINMNHPNIHRYYITHRPLPSIPSLFPSCIYTFDIQNIPPTVCIQSNNIEAKLRIQFAKQNKGRNVFKMLFAYINLRLFVFTNIPSELHFVNIPRPKKYPIRFASVSCKLQSAMPCCHHTDIISFF